MSYWLIKHFTTSFAYKIRGLVTTSLKPCHFDISVCYYAEKPSDGITRSPPVTAHIQFVWSKNALEELGSLAVNNVWKPSKYTEPSERWHQSLTKTRRTFRSWTGSKVGKTKIDGLIFISAVLQKLQKHISIFRMPWQNFKWEWKERTTSRLLVSFLLFAFQNGFGRFIDYFGTLYDLKRVIFLYV